MVDEANHLIQKIISERDTRRKTVAGGVSNFWKPPEIDLVARTFEEGARYFKTRNYGLKYLPPPKAETVQELQNELNN